MRCVTVQLRTQVFFNLLLKVVGDVLVDHKSRGEPFQTTGEEHEWRNCGVHNLSLLWNDALESVGRSQITTANTGVIG